MTQVLCLAVLTAEFSLRAQPPTPPKLQARAMPSCSPWPEPWKWLPPAPPSSRPRRPNKILHLGDQVRSGKASRATLRLSDKSVLRLYELTTLEIKPPQQTGHNDVIDVKAGATYFFNRDKPQETQFQTPSASGAIRGTEFNLVVREDGQTELTLLDGQVDLTNEQGSLQLQSGEQASIAKGQAPKKPPPSMPSMSFSGLFIIRRFSIPINSKSPPSSKHFGPIIAGLSQRSRAAASRFSISISAGIWSGVERKASSAAP